MFLSYLIMKRGLLKNRKGLEILSTTVFLVLAIIVFVGLLYFSYDSASGAYNYERMRAKQIGMIIDGAKPGMTVFLEMNDEFDIAEENKMDFDEVVKVDNEKGSVSVSFDGHGGFVHEYISDYDVSTRVHVALGKKTLEIKIS